MKKLSSEEINQRLESLDGWTYEKDAIHTSFKFDDFKDAFTVMTRIAFEAEALQHHPNWGNVYNELEITLSTHDANGVTEKDFELAMAIESIIGSA